MLWKLSKQVWWGNYQSVAHPDVLQCGMVICVAHNLEDMDYKFKAIPGRTIYVRHARGDHDEADVEYAQFLQVCLALAQKHTPLLVHCRAGQHRSVNVAVLAECLFTGRSYADVFAAAQRLRPDVQRKEFSVSLIKHALNEDWPLIL